MATLTQILTIAAADVTEYGGIQTYLDAKGVPVIDPPAPITSRVDDAEALSVTITCVLSDRDDWSV